MRITLTKEEMRSRLRCLAGLDPERSDCSVEYTDGVSLDDFLDIKLRSWYLALLSDGDVSLLAPADAASAARCTAGPAGGVSVDLPAMCRRVCDIRLAGWHRAATVLPASECAATVRRQSNPFLAATADSPVAVVAPGGSGGAMGTVFAWPYADKAELLTVVLDTGPDTFSFDETALGQLDKLVASINII